MPGSFAQVDGGVWGFEGARVVGPAISQILPFHMILAKLSKIKLLLLIGLKFLSSLSEKLLVWTLLVNEYIYGGPILDVSRSHTTTQHSR